MNLLEKDGVDLVVGKQSKPSKKTLNPSKPPMHPVLQVKRSQLKIFCVHQITALAPALLVASLKQQSRRERHQKVERRREGLRTRPKAFAKVKAVDGRGGLDGRMFVSTAGQQYQQCLQLFPGKRCQRVTGAHTQPEFFLAAEAACLNLLGPQEVGSKECLRVAQCPSFVKTYGGSVVPPTSVVRTTS